MHEPDNDRSTEVHSHLSDLVARSRDFKQPDSHLPDSHLTDSGPHSTALSEATDQPTQCEIQDPESSPGLATPTFRLSTLMTVTSLLCVGFALAKVVNPILSGLVGLLLFIVLAHVLGNALGTQLRKSSQHAKPLGLDDNVPTPGSADDADVFAPATRLSQHTQLGLGTIIMTAPGAIVGAVMGSGILWWSMKGDASIPAMALGVGSCAVLGGFAGFGMASLFGALGGAVVQAHQDPSDRRP